MSNTHTSLVNRPTHVMHPTIDALCEELRAAKRDELVHYAGASYRDDVAWQMCLEWMADRTADEATLKSRAYKATGWGDISPEEIRAAWARMAASGFVRGHLDRSR